MPCPARPVPWVRHQLERRVHHDDVQGEDARFDECAPADTSTAVDADVVALGEVAMKAEDEGVEGEDGAWDGAILDRELG